MNVMMELRKCCNHPFLIRGAEDKILLEAAKQTQTIDPNAAPDYVKIFHEQLVKSSGKMVLIHKVSSTSYVIVMLLWCILWIINLYWFHLIIDFSCQLLPKLFANGHKVLIFSQMVRVLDLLEELLKMMRYKYERLDGSTRSSSRAAAVERFIRKSCQRFVMLLSTRVSCLDEICIRFLYDISLTHLNFFWSNFF